ncbi:MAG: LysE family translocator, partial [Ornithinimicrobium sp.]
AWGHVYVIATVAGLGVLLARSPTALNVIRVVGACYLAYLCLDTVRSTGGEQAEAPGGAHVFRRGFIVDLTDPKIALFFIAFLPQFLGDAEADPYPGRAVRRIVEIVAGQFDRIIRADRPIVTAMMLLGLGFAFSLLVGLLFGRWLRTSDLRSDAQLAWGCS